MNTLRLSPRLQAEKLHTDSAQAQADKIAQRGRRQWLEIRVPGEQSGGFGKPSSPEILLGPFLGTFTPALQPTSTAGDFGGVSEKIEWEIGLQRRIVVPNNARIASPHFVPQWEKQSAYAAGHRVTSRVSQLGTLPLFECIKAGNSGATQPVWPLQNSATIADGTVIWKLFGYVTFYEVIGMNTGETHTTQTILRAKELS